MTTIRTIINDAYQESSITEIGVNPEPEEFSYGLRRFQMMVKTLFGREIGENFIDLSFGTYGITQPTPGLMNKIQISNTYIPANSRLIFNINEPLTLRLDPNPRDGERLSVIDNQGNLASNPVTIDANGRQIESELSLVLDTSGVKQDWFYRSDLGEWVKLSNLTENDESPLPEEFDDFLVLMLTSRLNPKFGLSLPADLSTIYRRNISILKSRYAQTRRVESELALQINPRRNWHSWNLAGSYDPTSTFNNGII